MRMTAGQAINILAGNVSSLKEKQNRSLLQRRNSVVNIYGQVLTGKADYGQPAMIGFSISPDVITYSQFAIKIELNPFYMNSKPTGSTGGSGSESVYLNVDKSLSLNDYQLATKGDIDSMFTSDSVGNVPTLDKTVGGSITISPNPHNHGGGGGGGSYSTTADFDPSSIKILLDGVDLTPYFKAQNNGEWLRGYGVYPTDEQATYDILWACGFMSETDRDIVLHPRFKRFTVYSDGIVEVKIHLYLMYNSMNR